MPAATAASIVVCPADPSRPLLDAIRRHADPADAGDVVRGVGPQTAARLLDGGLTLEEELRASGRLTGRIGLAVTDQWKQILAWRELIRFDDAVPLPRRPSGSPTPQLPPPAAVLEELCLW